MARDKVPATAAIRLLKQHKIKFIPRSYKYEERGGTRASARELQIDEHLIIKTLVMEDEQQRPLIVLMHGDCEVSLKHLARQLKVKKITPCTVNRADSLTGYQTGGISPLGTRQTLPIYMEETIGHLEKLIINGGKRGLLVELSAKDLIDILNPTTASVAI